MDDGNGNLVLQSPTQFTMAETGLTASAGLDLGGAVFNSVPLTVTAPLTTLKRRSDDAGESWP